jgi:hypothetical protein
MSIDGLSRAREVRKRHERDLLALKGVQGVGIGSDNGLPLIKVYVDESYSRGPRRIPTVLEEIPVVVELSGHFEAG